MRATYPILAVSLTAAVLLGLRGLSLAEAPHTPRRVAVRSAPPVAPTKNAQAIDLLREAYRRTADETRPDQRDILLMFVCEWLAFAGDDATAAQAAGDARVIARTYKDDFEKASHLRTAARLFGLAGASEEAWATCREIRRPNERDYAFREAAEALAKRDQMAGMFEAIPEIKNESLRFFALMPVAESCLRRNDDVGWEKTVALVPEAQRTSLAMNGAFALERAGRADEARALRERYGLSHETGVWLGPFQRFVDAPTVDEDELFATGPGDAGRDDTPFASPRLMLLFQVGQVRFTRGDAVTARVIWSRAADEAGQEARRVTPRGPLAMGYGVNGQPTGKMSEEDRVLDATVQRLCNLSGTSAESAVGSTFLLRRAMAVAGDIRHPEAQGSALYNILSHAFGYDAIALAREVALTARHPGYQATMLVRVAREETFVATKKDALETLRQAERVTARIPSVALRVECYCVLTMARKRAGDAEGAGKDLARARGNFAENPTQCGWTRPLLAQACAEVGNLAEGRRVVGEIQEPLSRVTALIRMAYAYLPDARPSRRLEPTLQGGSQLPGGVR